MNTEHHRLPDGTIDQSVVDLGPEMYRLTYRVSGGDSEYFMTSRGVVSYEALTNFQKTVFDAMRFDAAGKA